MSCSSSVERKAEESCDAHHTLVESCDAHHTEAIAGLARHSWRRPYLGIGSDLSIRFSWTHLHLVSLAQLMSDTSEKSVIWEKAAPYRRKVLVADTPVGRYIIARAYLGAPDHRLWLNGAPTDYRGTIDFLKRTVDEIIFGPAKPPDVEEHRIGAWPLAHRDA